MDEDVASLKQFLSNNVSKVDLPRLEEDLKKTLTLGKRKGRKKINEKRTKKSKYITRKEKKALGLFHLPRKGMKYEDVLTMHQMWKDYMRQQLDLGKQSIPLINEKAWDSFSQTIFKSDFHGAMITVSQSKCPSLVGVTGICVIDTKNTFKLLCKDDIVRTIPKEQSAFVFHLDDINFTIFGKHINRRPAERSIRHSKLFMLSTL